MTLLPFLVWVLSYELNLFLFNWQRWLHGCGDNSFYRGSPHFQYELLGLKGLSIIVLKKVALSPLLAKVLEKSVNLRVIHAIQLAELVLVLESRYVSQVTLKGVATSITVLFGRDWLLNYIYRKRMKEGAAMGNLKMLFVMLLKLCPLSAAIHVFFVAK